MKSNKGFTLIEIAVGLVIIVVFLFCTGSLINASFTNYRLVLQRSEALDIAIREMENILQSDSVNVSSYGYEENSMKTKIDIENVKDGDRVYTDKVFLVTVRVEYLRNPNSTQKYNVELQSLKVME